MMIESISLPADLTGSGQLADRLYVPDQRRHICIRQSAIVLVRGARSSVELLLADGNRRVVSTHLSQFPSYPSDDLFVQVSRSHSINLLFLESIHAGSVEVGSYVFPLSGIYRANLLNRLKLVRLRPEVETPASP